MLDGIQGELQPGDIPENMSTIFFGDFQNKNGNQPLDLGVIPSNVSYMYMENFTISEKPLEPGVLPSNLTQLICDDNNIFFNKNTIYKKNVFGKKFEKIFVYHKDKPGYIIRWYDQKTQCFTNDNDVIKKLIF